MNACLQWTRRWRRATSVSSSTWVSVAAPEAARWSRRKSTTSSSRRVLRAHASAPSATPSTPTTSRDPRFASNQVLIFKVHSFNGKLCKSLMVNTFRSATQKQVVLFSGLALIHRDNIMQLKRKHATVADYSRT